MAAIFQTFPNGFPWMKMFEFPFNFHRSLFLRVLLTIFSALVKIMAWCRPGNRPLSETMLVSLLTHICITQPQWVNINPVHKQRSHKHLMHRPINMLQDIYFFLIFKVFKTQNQDIVNTSTSNGRLWNLQCSCTGDTTVLYQVINISCSCRTMPVHN